VFRVAHVSDLHVLSPFGFEWRQVFFNKRITGYANLIRQRGRVYRREYLAMVLSAAAKQADHLVVTGDITNLSLEHEFEEARKLLDAAARTIEVTVVPGNHDVYLPSIQQKRRFWHHFGQFLRSDLPSFARDLQTGPFPCVKLRGAAAIIALSSAVPRPPFIASGRIGDEQLTALAELLVHPEVVRRMPMVLIHHPPVDRRCRLAQLRDGLIDSEQLRSILSRVSRGLVLFGHTHVRVRETIPTAAGALEAISASGAALDHRNPAVRAGFNRYSIGDDGRLASAEAFVVSQDAHSLERVALPVAGGLA